MQTNSLGAPSKVSPVVFFHTGSLVTMKTSAYIRIRKDRPTKDGSAAVYLSIRINSQHCQIPLELSWPVAHFDNSRGLFQERYKGDQTATDYNMYAQKQLAKANEIFIYFRHTDIVLSTDRFMKEFVRYGLRDNFLTWAAQDNEDRFADNKIELQTYKNIKSQLKRVSKWKAEIPFSDLNKDLLESLDAWLRKKEKMSNNGAWAVLKTMKSQAARAAEAGLHFDMEGVSKYQLPTTQRRIVYLTAPELVKLWDYYRTEDISTEHKRVLSCFLFSTLTGLRFSDVERVTWKSIHDDILIFTPHKTRGTSKSLELLIPDDAWELIHNPKGKLFNTATLQHHNETLKEIAQKCRVRKNLTTHVARHTFATEYLREGGQVHILQLLMGHTKIATTMVYVHVDQEVLHSAMRSRRAPAPGALAPLG
jgi:integrase/recombinase XerD